LSKNDSRRPHERVVDYIDYKALIEIEPRVYTINEILKMAQEERRITYEILTQGKP